MKQQYLPLKMKFPLNQLSSRIRIEHGAKYTQLALYSIKGSVISAYKVHQRKVSELLKPFHRTIPHPILFHNENEP